jgi:hypothetical protein
LPHHLHLEEAEMKPPVQAQMKKPSFAEITADKPPPDQSLHIITKFLDELKFILNPIITALPSLINKITLPIALTP